MDTLLGRNCRSESVYWLPLGASPMVWGQAVGEAFAVDRILVAKARNLAMVAATAAALFGPGQVLAADFGVSRLQLFGAKPAPGSVAFKLALSVDGPAQSLEAELRQASLLADNEPKGVGDTAQLVALTKADVKRLTAVLLGQGYYGGSIDIAIAGKPSSAVEQGAAVEADGPIAVDVAVRPGARFKFGAVAINYVHGNADQPVIEPQRYGLVAGKPARSTVIVAALDKIVADLRRDGFALARIADKRIVADHASKVVEVTISVDAGRRAKIGTVTVTGANRLDAAKINAHTGLRPGQPYDPDALRKVRERLRKFESIDGVRLREGDALDADGALPITVDVSERKARFVGAAAAMSSLDGGEVQAYWGHRNMFGGGERLRVSGTLSHLGANGLADLDYKLAASVMKPGIYDIGTDLVGEVAIVRERPDTFDSKAIKAVVAVKRQFDKQLSGSLGVEGAVLHVEDEIGSKNFALVGLPVEVAYDARDRLLDPSRGWRAALQVTPYADLKNGDNFVSTRVQTTHYLALDAKGRMVLAARTGFGSIVGAAIDEVPAPNRFFAGGGGSVRGYAFRGIGVESDGRTVGGLGLAEGSLELRYRLSRTIGVVPFIDAGSVSRESYPTFSDAFRLGAGVGLRYYTGLGPIRVDLAMPINPRQGDPRYGIYVGLGQSF